MRIAHETLAKRPTLVDGFTLVHVWLGNWGAYLRPDGKGHTEHQAEAGIFPAAQGWEILRQRKLTDRGALVSSYTQRGIIRGIKREN